MFLAPAPALPLLELADYTKKVLGGEVRRQRCARPANVAVAEADGLEGDDGMAVRAQEIRAFDGATE
jgi:hypothetical protein